MRILLKDMEIYGIVTGDDPKPVIRKRNGEDDRTANERYAEALKTWCKKDNKVQRYLSTTICDQAVVHIMNCDTGYEMWKKLHSVYEQKSETSVHLIQQKLFAYQMNEGDSMASHISKLEDLAQQLKDLGAPIEQSTLVTKILMTLPSNYSHFHVAWESTASIERTLDNLTSRLLVEESRMTAFENVQLNSTAFSVSSSMQRRKGNLQKRRVPGKCFKCNKAGHWHKDCPNSGFSEDVSVKSRGDANAYRRTDTGDALISEAFIGEMDFYSTTTESEEWHMDSGASDHISNKIEWFYTYTEFTVPLPVRIGDGKFLYAIGKGDINIIAFDGENWFEKRLLDVLFVPDIKLQLFSLSTALDKDLTFNATRDRCYFSKGSVTVAVGVRKNKLFEMMFKVIEPEAKLTRQANIAGSGAVDVLKLWHERPSKRKSGEENTAWDEHKISE